MGFISLLLTFSQSYIARICISEKLADNMLPCAPKITEEKSSTNAEEEPNRRLLAEMILANMSPRRILAGGESGSNCSGVGLGTLFSIFTFKFGCNEWFQSLTKASSLMFWPEQNLASENGIHYI